MPGFAIQRLDGASTAQIVELGPQSHSKDGGLGADAIMVAYMIPVRPTPPPPRPPNGSVVWCGPGVGLLGVVPPFPPCGMVWVPPLRFFWVCFGCLAYSSL